MNTLKTILVPVDFSTGSRSALEQASRLAGINGASLHVLHVVDTAAVASQADSRNMSFERQAAIAAEGAREALVRWLAQAGAPAGCENTIVVGVPLHEILKHIKTQNPDLVVAGITGAGESKAGAGSLAHRLARQVPGKILLVRTNHPNAFHKIVACIDFSETSREVAAQAHRAAIHDGARVDFLHVWQEPWLSTPYAYLATVASEFIEHRRQLLSATLQKFVKEIAPGIESNEVLINEPNYANAIADHAEMSGADLIVIGARGQTNLRYTLMGSTAERLLMRLPCSVLVVKPAME
ncbi:universal stress protein [Prosthecobacter sp.]|uniref:universal stress protein n=1 Tax=Prosthecobacter sp. TaxID=1965333 RepID=UPI0024875142|nr:universal stress protein [Prosthecobacter sp.]MDI1310573.1 universal stress protein [Prosthecobacter sp.]